MTIALKHILDKIAAAALLLLLSPLLVMIAASIKLCDGGPVLFRQLRPGKDERLFSIWKFRTMIVDADRFLDANGRSTVENRVTSVGRLLRRTSLDELPQLWNILRGEMSLVGPRPISLEHLPKLSPWQRIRFRMRPGVTGLAQINGRNTLKWSKRIEYDVTYVENYGLLLDLKILARTCVVALRGDGVVLDRNPQDVNDLAAPGSEQCNRRAA